MRGAALHEDLSSLAPDMALFIDSAADRAMFLTDCGGIVRSWNRGAVLLTGWETTAIVGKPAALLYPGGSEQSPAPANLHFPSIEDFAGAVLEGGAPRATGATSLAAEWVMSQACGSQLRGYPESGID